VVSANEQRTYSACPPSVVLAGRLFPYNSPFAHRDAWPRTHSKHAVKKGTTTLSPILNFLTESPFSTISPTNSCPQISQGTF
jgi:hypothetical protein